MDERGAARQHLSKRRVGREERAALKPLRRRKLLVRENEASPPGLCAGLDGGLVERGGAKPRRAEGDRHRGLAISEKRVELRIERRRGRAVHVRAREIELDRLRRPVGLARREPVREQQQHALRGMPPAADLALRLEAERLPELVEARLDQRRDEGGVEPGLELPLEVRRQPVGQRQEGRPRRRVARDEHDRREMHRDDRHAVRFVGHPRPDRKRGGDHQRVALTVVTHHEVMRRLQEAVQVVEQPPSAEKRPPELRMFEQS